MRVLVLMVAVGVLFALVVATEAQQKTAPVKPPAKPLAPAEALQALNVGNGLKLEQVLTEPTVAQPIFSNFDERGRLWVVQYLQYPFPAGLKILSEDKFLRATYDKVPPPPPHHSKGRDRITIHEDTDGNGTFDRHKTFIEGLNIVTSCVRGRGGIWMLNPPYLLFYPDRDNDDVPDGDPVVHLEGFGLEDTHSCVNNLQWGPDGWLYAAQGSTVTGAVKHYGVQEPAIHSMGQLIWRYHPETRRYEIFAEGGGNAFGLEIDAQGRIFSGYNGGETRGFHYVQGGYYQKGFGKHGELSNPFTFGYFPAMLHQPRIPRFAHASLVYEENTLPSAYRGLMLSVNPLERHVACSERLQDRSSFKTKDVSHALTSADPWFRPVHIHTGPDGAVYVVDMYEEQIAHLRHHEGKIDITNGRIYRFQAPGVSPLKPFDYNKSSTAELVELLRHPAKWHRRMALRLLGDRKDAAAIPLLQKMLESPNAQDCLEALWGLNASGGFNDALAQKTLEHRDPYVRLWTVRLLADAKKVSPAIAARLVELAKTEPHVEVRSQLACSARRLPAADGLAIVRQLLARDQDSDDIHIPLLLWWAIEARCEAERDRVLQLFEDTTVWNQRLVQTHILHRLMRRFAATGNRKDLLVCAQLLKRAPDAAGSKLLMRGFEEAFQGRPVGNLPDELAEALAKHGGTSLIFGLRQNKPEAVEKALAVLANEKADRAERLQYIQVFGEVRQPRCVPVLLDLVENGQDAALRLAALTALRPYDDARIAPTVIRLYSQFNDDLRSAAQTLLAGRQSWALQLLEAIDQGKIDRKGVPLDTARLMTRYPDQRVAQLLAKHWGKIEGATTAEMKQQIERLENVLRSGTGSPYPGKKLFKDTCAKCHKLFTDGAQVGPDLTAFRRDDIANMLIHIVNPSAEIREGYETLLVTTRDGRLITGILAEKDNQVLVLKGADGQKVSVRHDQVEEALPQKQSLMPEGLLNNLTDQQVRDLFAYLRSTQPLND